MSRAIHLLPFVFILSACYVASWIDPEFEILAPVPLVLMGGMWLAGFVSGLIEGASDA